MIWVDPRFHVAVYMAITLLFYAGLGYVVWLSFHVWLQELSERLERLEKN